MSLFSETCPRFDVGRGDGNMWEPGEAGLASA